MKRFLIFGGIAAVAIAIIFLTLKGAGGGNTLIATGTRKTADKFAQNLVNGDTKASYAMLSARSKKMYTQLAWTGQLRTVTGFYDTAKFKAVKVIIPKKDGTYGEDAFTYQAVGKDKSNHLFRISVREDADGKTYVTTFSAVSGVYNAAKK